MKKHQPLERYDVWAPENYREGYWAILVNGKRYLGSVYSRYDKIRAVQLAAQLPTVKGWNIDAFRIWCVAKGYQLEKY